MKVEEGLFHYIKDGELSFTYYIIEYDKHNLTPVCTLSYVDGLIGSFNDFEVAIFQSINDAKNYLVQFIANYQRVKLPKRNVTIRLQINNKLYKEFESKHDALTSILVNDLLFVCKQSGAGLNGIEIYQSAQINERTFKINLRVHHIKNLAENLRKLKAHEMLYSDNLFKIYTGTICLPK